MSPSPRRPSAPDELDSGPRSLPWLPSGEVLLADDDGPIRKVLSRALERFGMTVVEVSNGVEAVAEVKAAPDRFRLAILDLTMPRLGGDAALIQIREVAPDLPALILSGYLEAEMRDRVPDATRLALLQKPFSMRSLADALWLVLGDETI